MSMHTSQAHVTSLKLCPARAPTLVLYSIFHYLATGWTDAIPIHIWMSSDFKAPGRHVTNFYTVFSAALVNKHWNSIATLVIYESILVHDEKNAEDLRETLKQSPHLASIVTRLDLGTTRRTRNDTQCHIDVIGLCSNLQHLKIRGYNTYLLEEFRTALKKHMRLRSLYITKYGEQELLKQRVLVELDPFCSVAVMFEMFKCWPDLESVHFDYLALGNRPERFPRDFDAQPIKSLKSFHIGCILEKDELEAVMRMTPNLERFSISEGGFRDGKSLAKALEGWKESLVSVNLWCEPNCAADDSEWEHVTAVLPSLTRLEDILLCDDFPASKCTAAFPPSLKRLYISISKASHVGHIMAALQNEDYIPKLHALHIARPPGENVPNKEFEKLAKVCIRRGYSTCRIFAERRRPRSEV